MKIFCLFACLCGVLASVGILPGATLNWTNISGGNWNVAAHWSPNQVPTAADDAFITNAGTYTVAFTSAGNANSLSLGSAGGTQTLAVGSVLTVANGINVNPNGVLTLENGANIAGGGTFGIAAGGTFVLKSTATISHPAIQNAGTFRVEGQRLTLAGNGTFTNLSSGILRLTTNSIFRSPMIEIEGGSRALVSQGEIQSDVFPSEFETATLRVPLRQEGTMNVLSGTLRVEHSSTNTGTVNISAGATLLFTGFGSPTHTFLAGSSVTGAGRMKVNALVNFSGTYGLTGLLDVDSGTINFNTGSPVSVPHVRNHVGNIGGPDPLTITGTLSWLNSGKFSGPAPLFLAAGAQTTLEQSGTQVSRPFMGNAGTMNWISGDLQLGANSVFTNLPGGVIVITNAPSLQNTFIIQIADNVAQAFYNEGLMRLTANSAVDMRLPFFNSGLVRVERNQLQIGFNANFVQTAGVTELAGGELRFLVANVNNFRLFGGSLTGNGNVLGDDVENFGGTISPGTSPGQISFGRSLDLNPAGIMHIELGGTDAATGFDKTTVADTAILTGGILSVTLTNGFTPAVGMKFQFLTHASRVGTFQAFNYPSNQVALQLNYLPSAVELEVLQVVTPLQISPGAVTVTNGENQTFSAAGGTAPYTFAFIQNNSGGNIDTSTGLYTAGPTNGVTDIVIVTDASTTTAQATVQVIAPLQILPANVVLTNGQTQTFTASGGTAPYVFSLVQNNSGGMIGGASGLYTAGPTGNVIDTVRVTDSSNRTAQATVSIIPNELTLVVTTTTEIGPGSLRQAILDANAALNPLRRIHFDIPGPPTNAVRRIEIVALPLPDVTRPVVIDGTTQPGFAGTPIIEIRGDRTKKVAGLYLFTSNCVVRGLVINSFRDDAIVLDGAGGHTIHGNFIGIDPSGVVPTFLSGNGILALSPNNLIGGTTPAERNVISGNLEFGIWIDKTTNNRVLGNFIGTDLTGTVDSAGGFGLRNGRGGIQISSTNDVGGHIIGGTEPGAANVIAFNFGAGIIVTQAIGVSIRGNSLFRNSGLGIDLGATGITPGFPIITNVANSGTNPVIRGVVEGGFKENLILDFYANAECDASGNGEGQRYLGSTNVGTGASGIAAFSFTPTLAAPGLSSLEFVTATVTDSAGSTSEFSPCAHFFEHTFVVTTTNDSGPGSLRRALDAADSNSIPLWRIHFNIPGSGSPVRTISPVTALPVIARPVVIDGTTQPGFAGTPIIEIEGSRLTNGLGVNREGFRISTSNCVIRGLVINRFADAGLDLRGSGGHVVQGNFIGTDPTGTIPQGNPNNGIVIFAPNTIIGGTGAADRNLISANKTGILIDGLKSNNVVHGNLIGTDITGAHALGSQEEGVVILADGSGFNTHNLIGGELPGAGNVIAFHTRTGIRITKATANRIQLNAIFGNGELGIDLTPTGVTPNDPGDIDIGANNLQNFPIVTRVVNPGTTPIISGTLNSAANATYTIDFYANSQCDSSGHGEGERYLGSINLTTDASGNGAFSFATSLAPPGLSLTDAVTATATDTNGNTSEFSPCGGFVSSISGRVQHSGTPLAGATIQLFGVRTGTANTDATGNCAFNDLPIFGAYTVVPSKAGFVFTPQSQSFSNLAVPGVANFTAAVGAYTISGSVRDTAGNAIASARITLSRGAAGTTATDMLGAYVFRGLPGLSNYTLTVSKAGFTFGPPTNINNLTANRRVDFIGAPPAHNITGRIRTAGGQPVAGVTVQVFPFTFLTPGNLLQSVQADAQGMYQLINLPSNQRYLVRLSSSQFVFQPSSATLLLQSNDLSADFTATSAHRISGQIIANGGFPGVRVQFIERITQSTSQLRASTITDTNGNYTSPLLPDGADYEIHPTSPIGTFTPESLLVLNLASDVPGQNFSGTRQNFRVSGRVLNGAGLAVSHVSMSINGGSQAEQPFGTFSFFLAGGNSYMFTPGRTGFSFAPTNIVINSLTNDQQIEFHATPLLPLTGRIALIDEIPRIMNADATGIDPGGPFTNAPASSTCPPGYFPNSAGQCVAVDPFGESADLLELIDDFLDSDSITGHEFLNVALSPDGRNVVFTERTSAITIEPLGNTTTEINGRLWNWGTDLISTPAELADGTFGRGLSWSANGARIAFARPASDEFAPGLYLISPDGSSGTVVGGIGANPRDPALSPDGTRVAFAIEILGQYDLFIANVNGTGLTRVTTSSGDDVEPSWSPNGQSIAFASNRGGDFEIFRMDTQQFQESVLTSNDADDRQPTWSPDGTLLAFVRNGVIHAMNASNGSLETPLRTGSSPSWGRVPTYSTPASSAFGQDVTLDAGPIDITFNGVTSAGDTTVTTISPIADPTPLPEGYFTLGETDFAFDITTTASFLAPVGICLRLEGINDSSRFNQLSILHNENGQLEDVTVSRNFAARQICGAVSNLSPFRLAMKIDPVLPLITGTVMGSGGAPLPGVFVALDGNAKLTARTDLNGEFTFGNLAGGSSYTVTPLDLRYAFLPSTAFVENLAGTNALVFSAIPIASPTLSISPDRQNPAAFNLTWPIVSWPFVLESTGSLTSPNWTPVVAPLATIGDNFVVSVQATGATRFFRLRQP